MKPTDFKGSNITMKAPIGAENVADIRAFRNAHCCVTAWQFTADELEELNRTGTVYLSVFMGGGMPPVFIGTESAVRAMCADYGSTFDRQPLGSELNPLPHGQAWPEGVPIPAKYWTRDERGILTIVYRSYDDYCND